MIWLTWRQFRVQAVAVLGALAAAAVLLAVTGPQLADMFRRHGDRLLRPARPRRHQDGDLRRRDWSSSTLVPAVVGVFWGAPLVARELEAGTHRLVWNQSVTRTRWLAIKLGARRPGAALAGLSGLALTWWCAPLDDAIAQGYNDRGTVQHAAAVAGAVRRPGHRAAGHDGPGPRRRGHRGDAAAPHGRGDGGDAGRGHRRPDRDAGAGAGASADPEAAHHHDHPGQAHGALDLRQNRGSLTNGDLEARRSPIDSPGAWITYEPRPSTLRTTWSPSYRPGPTTARHRPARPTRQCRTPASSGSPTRVTASTSSTCRPPVLAAPAGRDGHPARRGGLLLTGFCFWRIRRDFTLTDARRPV